MPATHLIMYDRNNQLIILGHVFKFALKCKNWYRIGPRSDVGGRTVAKSGEVFYGRSICRLEGGRTAKGGRTEVFTSLYNRPLINIGSVNQTHAKGNLSSRSVDCRLQTDECPNRRS